VAAPPAPPDPPAPPLDPVEPLEPLVVLVVELVAPPDPPVELVVELVVEAPEDPPVDVVGLPPRPPSGFTGGAWKSRDELPQAVTTKLTPEKPTSQVLNFIDLCAPSPTSP
jgi:homeobox protein ESX1